jgi:hypothetical protein
MSQSLIFRRSLSLCVAAALTLAMLGSIDTLAQRQDGPMQWAQTAPTRA